MCASDFSPTRRSPLYRAFAICVCLCIVAGCAATRPAIDLPELPTWELRQAVLGNISDWKFRGRIAVKAGDEGFNGKISWTQADEKFHASVGGPLGIGTVRIDGDRREVVLTDKDELQTTLVNPEEALYRRYGWTIPVASLRYWALGLPDPALAADTTIDDAGQLVELEQGGWQVTISSYRENAGQQMPRIMTASNSNTRVRMVIDRWRFFER